MVDATNDFPAVPLTDPRSVATGAFQDGFPSQQQQPPGETSAMEPRPDHGEESYRGSGRLQGLRALITGGDSGIGRAVAIAYAREGADVAFTYLAAEQSDADETTALIEDAGQKAVAIEVDLRERQGATATIEQTVEGLGGLDILVNNHAFQWARDESFADISDERIDRVITTNLTSIFWLIKDAIAHLAPGASIINVSSIQAYQPSTTLSDYAATKAALNNLTVNLAAELGPQGIRVNAVAPGPIWTPLQPATQAQPGLDKLGQDTPLGRAGQPAEVAHPFVLLASPVEASYISGTVIGVTGGKPIF